MHQRKLIRKRMVSMLKDGIPIEGTDPVQYMKLDVGGRVYAQRPEPVFETEYPMGLVYFASETVREVSAARDIIRRTVDVNVDLVETLRTGIEDELDRLAWQTEIILLSDHTMSLDFVNWIELSTVIPYQDNVDGEHPRGVTRLTFAVDYWTEAYMPGTLNEFLSFGKEITAQVGDGATVEIDQTIRSE